jgi:hypothetical protein
VSLSPGIYYNAAGGLWLFLRGQLPVATHLYGEQKVGATAATGVQYLVF